MQEVAVRRYARPLILIAVLVIVSSVILGIKEIDIGGFERGGDTMLGLSLGLDLQGGSHMVYKAALTDPETGEPIDPTSDQMEALKSTIERRVNASGLGEPIIQRLGDDRLLIQLPGVKDIERAESFIGETAQLSFKHRTLNVARDLDGLEEGDIVSVSAGPVPDEARAPTEEESGVSVTAESGVATSTPDSAVATSTPETTVATSTPAGSSEGNDPEGEMPEDLAGPAAIIVEFTEEGAERFNGVVERLRDTFAESLVAAQAGLSVPANRLDVAVEGEQSLRFELTGINILRIGSSTQFALGLPPSVVSSGATDVTATRAMLGPNPTIHFSEILGRDDDDIGLTGEDLARAYASQHSASGAPIVVLEFNSRGARIFGELTERIAGSAADQIAIFLDDEELIAPTVQTAITAGSAIIQGRDFTITRVRDIALLLESGRLPVPIEQIQKRTVDASLGADSLSKSVIAGLVGLGLVLAFMAAYYRVPGLVAAVALIIYGVLVLAIFKVLPVTLTLSGIAAVILSVGMAVDANILIFERMKDELRAGRTLLSSTNIGFNRAWPAIRDGNVSTLITCGILFWFGDQLGTTIVQGFAAALAIGVATSMFSAIVVSRTFLRVIATTGLSRRLDLFVPAGGTELPQQTGPATQRS